MKTSTIPVSAPAWHIVDAEDQILGRLASKVAHILRGKHRPDFSPHQLCGDHVIIINAAKLKFEQRKLKQKQYVKHSGYLGHLKSTSLSKMMETHPERVMEKAVKGMLPKNKLQAQILKRLHVYNDAEHIHTAQQPTPLTVS